MAASEKRPEVCKEFLLLLRLPNSPMPALRFQQPPFKDDKCHLEPLPSSNEKLGRQGIPSAEKKSELLPV